MEDVPFSDLRNTDVEPIFEAFTALPGENQAAIEAAFQEINAMACQAGMSALADEAAFHGDADFPSRLSRFDGFHEAVMWAFLEHPRYWDGATLFLRSDNISDTLWRKRNDLPHVPPQVHENDRDRLADAISQYFHAKEGRGRNCKVEVYRRYGKEYFFAYPEDYAQTAMEWIRNALSSQARHPAFEIIFVYCQDEGSLDIYAPRNTKSVPDLQRIFAATILKLDELDGQAADNRVYALDALANRDFTFRYPPESGIEAVSIRLLQLTLLTREKRRLILEADSKVNPKAIYDLLDQVDPPPFSVTKAEIKVVFTPRAGRSTAHAPVQDQLPQLVCAAS